MSLIAILLVAMYIDNVNISESTSFKMHCSMPILDVKKVYLYLDCYVRFLMGRLEWQIPINRNLH